MLDLERNCANERTRINPAASVRLNHELLSSAIDQNGPWVGQRLKTSDEWVRDELKKTIARLDWQKAREDVEPFIHETELETLRYFTAEYFTRLADGMI